MTLLSKLKFYLTTGTKIDDLGPVDEHVLHFKGIYIHVLLGEHTSVGWSSAPPTGFLVRDIVEL